MTDLPSPDSTGGTGNDVTVMLLGQILDRAHPLLAEAINLATVPHWYDAALLEALRAQEDGRDERLTARLARFSFIRQLDDAGERGPRYAMDALERQYLQQRWIAADPEAYVAAHRRALAFWESHPDPDPFLQDQTRLCHLLIVDGEAGIEHLGRTFRTYSGERRLAEVERLLATATETRLYVAALKAPCLADLDAWLAYLAARLDQLRGQWAESTANLKSLREQAGLSPELLPFVSRAYGIALAKTGDYVEAIEQYQSALSIFRTQPESEAEQAFTMISLGDAHVELAISARGQREIIPPQAGRWRQLLRGLLSFPVSFPLIIYLSLNFGSRVWNPETWHILRGQDWIIARLFGTSVRWYRRAGRLLDASGTPAGRAQADERLATLYLTLGDAAQAVPLFRALLEEQEAPPGEYRRAHIQASLGQALLRQGQHQAALEQLQQALPVIEAYDDLELKARVQGHLAEANFSVGAESSRRRELSASSEALHQYGKAMRLYQKQGDIVGATEIAERLQELDRDRRLKPRVREIATTTTQQLARRQYLVRFRHPALTIFWRAALILVPILIFLIPLLTAHVETRSPVVAEISFHAEPVLKDVLEEVPNYSPALDQSVALNVEPSFETGVAGMLALEFLLAYLLVYTVLGILVVARTRLSTVQAAQAGAVRLDLESLATGRGEMARTVRWREVTRIFTADVKLFGRSMLDSSSLVVATPREQITITSNTAWYATLRERIGIFLTGAARITDLSYSLLNSKMGVLYGLGLVSIAAFISLARVAPGLLVVDLAGTPYSIADLYAYLYLGLFLPPAWWAVVQPLRLRTRLKPRSRLAWWIGGAGLALAILRWATLSIPWLSQPDIYPLLAVIILLASAGLTIWTVRHTRTEAGDGKPRHVYPLWTRSLTAGVVLVVVALAGFRLWREVSTDHHQVVGDAQRDRGLQARSLGQDEQAVRSLEAAVTSFDRVLAVFPGNAPVLDSRAAVQAQLGRYQAAIADYGQVLWYSGADDENLTRQALAARYSSVSRPGEVAPDEIYASRAIAYQGWSVALSNAGDDEDAQEKLTLALADFDRAIRLNPDRADYYLWRGVAHHSLGNLNQALRDYQWVVRADPENARAFTGRGWVYFQKAVILESQAEKSMDETLKNQLMASSRENFEQALQSFQEAARHDDRSTDIWLAVGYAHFRLKQYPESLAAWERAVELDPDDPVTLVSRATGNWVMVRPTTTGTFACVNDTATGEEKASAVNHLNLAIDDLNRVLAMQPDDHLTYRTRAQIEYLLRFCPGYDFKTQVYEAIASYSEALKYSPDDDLYFQIRARLGYSLGEYIFRNEPDNEAEARAVLDAAIKDIDRAYAIDPAGHFPGERTTQVWHDFIETAWGRFHLLRGWDYYKEGKYRLSLADSGAGARLLPEHAVVAFNAGLAALALEDVGQATRWYNEGIERALAAGNVRALQEGIDDLTALLETNPGLRRRATPILEELRAAVTSLPQG